MPIRAQALTMHYFATDADGPKTGDVGNHALRVVEDGVVGTIAASPAEIDATNAPGMYKVAITAAENTADVVTLCGKSSTSGVTISPSTWTNITNADTSATAAASYATANNTAINTIDGIVDAILVDTGTTLNNAVNTIDNIVDAILVDTGTTLNDKIDVVDGIVDSILVDTGTTLNDKIDVVDGIVDAILVDTAALSSTDSGWATEASLDAAHAKIDTIDGIVDAILVDTGTTLDGKLDTIDGVVDATLTKATTAATSSAANSGKLDTIDGIVDDILVDTAALSTPIEANVTQVNGLDMSPTHTGTVKAGSTAGDIQLVNIGGETALSTVDNFYKGRQMTFVTGNLAGQARPCGSWTGSTLTATTDGDCTNVPDTGSVMKFR